MKNKKTLIVLLSISLLILVVVLGIFMTKTLSGKKNTGNEVENSTTSEVPAPEIIVENKIPDIDVTDITDENAEPAEAEESGDFVIDSLTSYDDDHNFSDSVKDEADSSEDDKAFNSSKRIVCWGDSLTEGTGGDGVTMPNTLEKLSGATVLNYGVYNEKVSCISARQGGNPQHLINETVIPSEPQLIPAQVEGKYGYETLLDFGDAGINPVILGGVEGTYKYDDNYNRCFIRSKAGDEITIPAGAEFITFGMRDKKDDDILVIWAGGNDRAQSTNEIPPILEKIDEILEYQGCSEYVVISDINPHCNIPVTDEVNKAFKRRYGKHFLDLRNYLVTEALSDMGVEPTESDKKAMENGDVPFSLRMTEEEGEAHGNPDFYRIAGEQVYAKMQELGYLK